MSHTYEHSHQEPQEPVKTGGILIKPEDAHESMRDQIHVDPRNQSTYAILKPYDQNVHDSKDASTRERTLELSRPEAEQDRKSGAHTHTHPKPKPADQDKENPKVRKFEYEFVRNSEGEDRVKTGGIVIKPEDAHPSMRDRIRCNKSTTYVQLKPPKQAMGDSKVFSREFKYEFPRIMEQDRVKTGGIVINPEDALPAMRDRIRSHKSGTYVQLLPPQQRQQQLQMQSQSHGSSGFHTRRFSYEFSRNEEEDRVKTGGIVIKPEDALPSMRHSIHFLDRSHVSYATLKPWSQVEAEQGGVFHGTASMAPMGTSEGRRKLSYEFDRKPVKEDRVKTGGIIINPEDAHPSMRDQIHVHPKSHATYANLKPWGKIRDEQGGIFHADLSSMVLQDSSNKVQGQPKKSKKRPSKENRDENTQPNTYLEIEASGKENMKQGRMHKTDMSTKNTLKALDSRLDSILMRSRGLLSEASNNSQDQDSETSGGFMEMRGTSLVGF